MGRSEHAIDHVQVQIVTQFLNENISKLNKTLIDKDINIHSISMIKEKFGKNYEVEVRRTFYSNWEKEDRISAILYIKKI